MKYHFHIQGSAPDPYIVVIERVGENLRASCTCAAGEKGQYCKHRFQLFKGSNIGVIGGDIATIPQLPNLVKGTDVERAMINLKEAESELVMAQKRVSAAKKAVAEAMRT